MTTELSGKQDKDIGNEKFQNNNSFPGIGELLLPYLRKIWAVRKKLLIFNGIVGIVTIIFLMLFVDPYYDSTITILPDYGSKSSGIGGLSSLAAMAGFSVGDGSSPADIYKNLLFSESVIEPVLSARYKSNYFNDSIDLYEYFEIDVDKSIHEEQRKRIMFLQAYGKFKNDILSVSVDATTKIMTLTVRMPESTLASEIANNIVRSLDEYIRTKRKSNSSLQRSYIETRTLEVNDSMTVAENKLKMFLLSNRSYSQSPDLVLEQTRLNRQIQLFQGVYLELMRQLEIAKIEQLRDAPVLNVREWAQDPIGKSGPSKGILFIAILFVSVVFSISFFVSYESIINYVQKIILRNN